MSDTTTITPEERAAWREWLTLRKRDVEKKGFRHGCAEMALRLLTALEAAEKALLKEEVYSEELESQLQHAREENERLRAERGWLAENAADRPCAYDSCPFGLHRPTGPDDDDCDKTRAQCWQEAARRAVAESEII
nr:hypothetical protein [uncultured Desulfovibrio sp.]